LGPKKKKGSESGGSTPFQVKDLQNLWAGNSKSDYSRVKKGRPSNGEHWVGNVGECQTGENESEPPEKLRGDYWGLKYRQLRKVYDSSAERKRGGNGGINREGVEPAARGEGREFRCEFL